MGIGEVAGAPESAKGQHEGDGLGSGDTEWGLGGRGGSRPGSGAQGGPGRETGVAARRALTAAERGLAVPDVQAGGFPAGLPQGQVVLVVGRDPGRAQHGPQIQTQRQEDAHQPDQLQRGQHRHAHLLHAAARRSHAPGAAAGPPRGRRGRQAGPESREPDLPQREAAEPPRARGLAPSELRALLAAPRRWVCGAGGRAPGRRQPQRCRSRRGPSQPAPRRVLPAPAPPRRCPARSLRPGPSPAAGGGAERGGAAVSTQAASGSGSGSRLPAREARVRPARARCAQSGSLLSRPRVPGARSASPLSCQSPVRSLRLRTAAPGDSSKPRGPRPRPWPRLLRGRLVSRPRPLPSRGFPFLRELGWVLF